MNLYQIFFDILKRELLAAGVPTWLVDAIIVLLKEYFTPEKCAEFDKYIRNLLLELLKEQLHKRPHRHLPIFNIFDVINDLFD